MTDYYGTYKNRQEVIEAWQRGELFITGFTSQRCNEKDIGILEESVTLSFDHVAEFKVSYEDIK